MNLFLYCPDLDEIVETYYWYAKGVITGTMDPEAARFLVLPPYMHRIYAALDSIQAKWQLKKSHLILVCAEGERKSRQKHSEEKLKKAFALASKKRVEEKAKKAMAYRGGDVAKLKKAISLLSHKSQEHLTHLIAMSKKRGPVV